jgi:hypothetical protein
VSDDPVASEIVPTTVNSQKPLTLLPGEVVLAT